MPQLDKLTFFSQLFWVLFIFISLYIYFVLYVLPRVFVTLRYRTITLELVKNTTKVVSVERLFLLFYSITKYFNIMRFIYKTQVDYFMYFKNSSICKHEKIRYFTNEVSKVRVDRIFMFLPENLTYRGESKKKYVYTQIYLTFMRNYLLKFKKKNTRN
jgi:hypothetical protein